MHKQRGKPGEMGKAVAIPPDKEAEKKEMFKVNHDMTHCVYILYSLCEELRDSAYALYWRQAE